MSHNHHHEYHDHHHHIPENKKILAISFAVITLFMCVEWWGGWYFNSLALLADAGHMANDSFSLLLALIALFLNAQKQRWFALLNGVSLLGVAAVILWEAVVRWQNPQEMMALPMLGVAVVGLLVNMGVAWLMLQGDRSNLNVKAAYSHVLADMLGSLVAIVSGLSAWLLGWLWVDTVVSMVLSMFILRSGWAIVCVAWQQDIHAEHHVTHHH